MTTLTLGNLLDRSARCEGKLDAYYADLRDGCTDNGIRLLTYYLRRQHQHQLLAQLSLEQLEAVRSVMLEPVAEFESPWMDRMPTTSAAPVSGDVMLEEAVALRGALVSYYRAAYCQLAPGPAHDLLGSLIQVEERDINMLNKMKDMQYL